MSQHPDCTHPYVNGSDDYSGVVCCLCDGNVCSAVTVPLALAHHDWEMAQVFRGEAVGHVAPF